MELTFLLRHDRLFDRLMVSNASQKRWEDFSIDADGYEYRILAESSGDLIDEGSITFCGLLGQMGRVRSLVAGPPIPRLRTGIGQARWLAGE